MIKSKIDAMTLCAEPIETGRERMGGILKAWFIFAVGTGSDNDSDYTYAPGDSGFRSLEVESQFGSQISATRANFRLIVGLGGPVNSVV